ncbi:MAG: hypothetical protein KatS3mg014_1832 [Actinomycetota bacterium]|nr:MAG: hypothetical protein KatS3mg014_1832 [Actinomycetota bacterium]
MRGPLVARARRAVALVAALLLASPLSGAPRSARATELLPSPVSGAVKLPLESFVAAEVSGDRLFVTGEPDRVLVLDLAGSEVARMNVVDPGGLEVVGETLFVVSVSRGKIQRFDLTTTPPTRLEPLDVSAAGQPDDIASGNGRLWLTSEAACDGAFPLWSVALDGTDLRGHDVGGYLACRVLSTDPHAPGLLALVDRQHELRVVDVSGETPAVTDMGTDYVCAGVSFGPAAETILLEQTYPTEYSIEPPELLRRFERDDLSSCNAVRVSAAGGGVVVAADRTYYGTRIDVWSYGEPTAPYAYFSLPENPYGLLWGQYPSDPATHGQPLVFSEDARWLFAFTGQSLDPPAVWLLILRPLERVPILKLPGFGYRDARYIDYGEAIELTGRLIGGTPAAVVRFYARPHGRDDWRFIGERTVDADGFVSLPVAPRVTTRYRLVYPGEEGWFGATTAGTVYVRVLMAGKLLKADGRSGRWRIYRADHPVFYAARVYPPYPQELVWVGLYRYGEGGGWRRVASGRFPQNRDGVIVVYVPAGALRVGEYRIRSSFQPEEHDRAEGWTRYHYFRIRS